MLNIIILEDELSQRLQLIDFIQRYCSFEDLDVSIMLATNDPQQIINLIRQNKDKHFLFILDIEINRGDITGIELAEKIRALLPFTNIDFLTCHEEHSMLTLERRISPLDYVLKNNGFDKVKAAIRKDIQTALKRIPQTNLENQASFTYKIRNRFYTIPVKDIYFFESIPSKSNRVILHAKDKILELDNNLKNIETMQSVFFRSHKSYSIQINNVKAFDLHKLRVYFDDQQQIFCPVSVRKASKLKKAIQHH